MLMFSSKWASINSRTLRSARGGKPPRLREGNFATDRMATSPIDENSFSGNAGRPAWAVLVEFRSMAVFLLNDEIRTFPAVWRAGPAQNRQRRHLGCGSGAQKRS